MSRRPRLLDLFCGAGGAGFGYHHGDGGGKGTVAQWQQAMGIHWTAVRKEIAESIPPAYAEYIGGYLMRAVEARRAA